MKIAAAIEPARLPMPPITTTIKAFRIQSRPMAWLTPTSGPNKHAAGAGHRRADGEDAVSTHGTGMPIA